jgi:DNA polymerase elongation subunit (family B)
MSDETRASLPKRKIEENLEDPNKKRKIDEPLIFQILDVFCGDDDGIKLIGRKLDGTTVCCTALKFCPSFCVLIPSFLKRQENEPHIKAFCNELCASITLRYHSHDIVEKTCFTPVCKPKTYLEIRTSNLTKFDTICRKLIDPNFYPIKVGRYGAYETSGFVPDQRWKTEDKEDNNPSPYAANAYPLPFYNIYVDTIQQFCTTVRLSAFKWARCETYEYNLFRYSTCTCDVNVIYSNLLLEASLAGTWAPFRILDYDIETSNDGLHFCTPDKFPVISIAVEWYDILSPTKITRKGFFLGELDLDLSNAPPHLVGMDLSTYPTRRTPDETRMLDDFGKYVNKCEIDIITGYNVNGFDLRYVIQRAKTIKANGCLQNLTRFRNKRASHRDYDTHTNQSGDKRKHTYDIPGLSVIDTLDIVLASPLKNQLRTFTLNAVAGAMFNETKEDVHYSMIPKFWQGDNDAKTRLFSYNAKDTWLTTRIFNKWNGYFSTACMALATRCSSIKILTKNQSAKSHGMIYDELLRNGYCMPAFFKRFVKKGRVKGRYVGAIVLKPIKGYYDTPVITLDFSSLYLSILIDENLSHDTYLAPWEKYDYVEGKDYEIKEGGHAFLLPGTRQGTLSTLLVTLGVDRKKINKALETMLESDPKYASMNAEQIALKLVGNSCYGITGCEVLALFLLAIAETVTAVGRKRISNVVSYIVDKLGYKVLYGDTVRFL